MQNNQLKYEDYFYSSQDLISEKHCKKTYSQTIDNDDIRRYRRFVKDCFALHLLRNPRKVLIDNIRLAPKESNRYYKSDDISNLFISQIYKYPSIKKHYHDDLSAYDKIIPGESVFEEILGYIANPNSAVVLVGDVGEGKSAFLQRLAVDLGNFAGDHKYLPIIIDIENFKNTIEKDNHSEAFEGFWIKVCEDIVSNLSLEHQVFIPTSESQTSEASTSTEVSFIATLKAIIAELKSTIKSTTTEKNSITSVRSFNIFSQIQVVARQLYSKENTRMVLIFDNLDTFCYEHERFMLFGKGFSKLKTKILTVRKIINEVILHLSHSEISFIFTARPYVYYHAFQRKVHEIVWNDVSAVYSLESVDSNIPMKSRLQLISILADILMDSDLPKGKKKAVLSHNDEFTKIINKCLQPKGKYFTKFYNLSNQGMRSMVEFYKSCHYHPELFPRYFTHNILYLYMLGQRELYSQLHPNSCSKEQKYYFPNMFLVMCNNYRNIEYFKACQPHTVTYWLKYLILWICHVRGKISIKEILSMCSGYEDHVVRLCIGSLSTVNEYNCLKMEFGYDIDFSMEIDDLDNSLKKFEETTYLSPTNRGTYLVEKHYCLGFECLQLYIDDWLMPLPKKDVLDIDEEVLKEIYEPEEKRYSYDYLLNVIDYEYERKNIIRKKAKQSILLLKFLESAFKWEQERNKNTWEKIKDISKNKNSLYQDDVFVNLQNKLIDDAASAYGKDDDFKEILNIYNEKLNNYRSRIDEVFKEAIGITVGCT